MKKITKENCIQVAGKVKQIGNDIFQAKSFIIVRKFLEQNGLDIKQGEIVLERVIEKLESLMGQNEVKKELYVVALNYRNDQHGFTTNNIELVEVLAVNHQEAIGKAIVSNWKENSVLSHYRSIKVN